MTRRKGLLTPDQSMTFLLVSLSLLMFGIAPFVASRGPATVLLEAAFILVLISATAACGLHRRFLLLMISLAAVTGMLRITARLAGTGMTHGAGKVLTILFLILTTGVILSRVMKAGKITRQRIQGAVAVYLLIGLIGGYGFSLIELHEPGAIDFGDGASSPVEAADPHWMKTGELFYFSFVTLTTLGYGDITPVGRVARTFATLEAIIGQLYLVLIIARLVSLEISSSGDRQ